MNFRFQHVGPAISSIASRTNILSPKKSCHANPGICQEVTKHSLIPELLINENIVMQKTKHIRSAKFISLLEGLHHSEIVAIRKISPIITRRIFVQPESQFISMLRKSIVNEKKIRLMTRHVKQLRADAF